MLDIQAVVNDFVAPPYCIWNIGLMHTAQNVHFSVMLPMHLFLFFINLISPLNFCDWLRPWNKPHFTPIGTTFFFFNTYVKLYNQKTQNKNM